jgi:uncharacterized membrane protein
MTQLVIDVILFYIVLTIFIFSIIFFINLYAKTKNNTYLILGILFLIIQNIYYVIGMRHIFSLNNNDKYIKNIDESIKSGLPLLLLFNSLLIIFITIFIVFYIKNKNYLFLILAIIFTLIYLYYTTGTIVVGNIFNTDINSNDWHFKK